ncbi:MULTISPECIES: hypothetical protein [Streptomyces]|uniref:Extensin n=1 Tax=Streptomyces dengpaensis TaxID=2049881 RepID=A0ABN5I250_9ACTN|nr:MULTISPECIES: hypothetical protein [Streptomyces]AVH56896.1 hypothetical protein C4B68_15130 [Streptomyces dengpaensis]PIB04755.1 hypothetical protein B1C81_31885 [Streptomyces sp. HG99]
MADERCVFPGDAPRPPGQWLDRDAAECLLRGEPLEAVDADTQVQADRLAKTLGALAAGPVSSSAELPGEAAALAAFRKARDDRSGEAVQLGRRGRVPSAAHASDAGLVRLGRPAGAYGRRVRGGIPVRFGIAAALAVGMVGGAAFAAGSGVLPTPFSDERPGPAASVTEAGTPERPLVSPSSPGVSAAGGSQAPVPDATTGGPSDQASPGDEAAGGGGTSARPSGGASDWRTRTRRFCRAVLNGDDLSSGQRRALEDAAGGAGRVKSYCAGFLGQVGGDSDDDEGDDEGAQQGDQGNQEDGRDEGSKGDGEDGGDDDDSHIRPSANDPRANGGVLTPSPSPSAPVLSPLLPKKTLASPAPSPTYSALSSLTAR